MSSEQEFDEGFQEDVAPDDGSAHEEAAADDQATDADFTDEEWSEGDETAEGGEGGEGEPDQKAARKKKMNMMLLGGAVVVGLGVAYMTMHKKTVPVPPPTNVPVTGGDPTQTDMVYADAGRGDATPGDKKKKPEGGFLTDPNLIKKAQKLSDGHVPTQDELIPEATHPVDNVHAAKPPQPTPIKSPDVDADENQPLTPMPQEVAGNMVKSGTPSASPGKQGTPAESVHAATPMTATTPTPTTATTPATTPSTNISSPTAANPSKMGESPFAAPTTTAMPAPGKLPSPSSSETMNASNAQLESITSKLDGIESQLKTLEGSVVHRDELADIHTQINALAQKVDALSTSGAAAAKPPSTGKTPGAAHVGHSRHVAAHKSPVAGTAKVHAQTWMLKSAMPGMAIVAGSDGQIMTVKPGDRVAGLGRIKSVSEKNGRWVVSGTAGSVHQ